MGRRKMWVRDPHSGGVKISDAVKRRTKARIEAFANEHYGGRFIRLGIRFHGKFCYIDAFKEPDNPTGDKPSWFEGSAEEWVEDLRNTPTHLCRLRFFGDEDAWSMAFYTYSNEKYEPCFFRNGTFHGTPEEAFETGALYL